MRKFLLVAALTALTCSLGAVEIVPNPTSMKVSNCKAEMPAVVKVAARGKALRGVAKTWMECSGNEWRIVRCAKKGFVRLSVDEALAEEGYTLTVTQDGVAIAGGSQKGVFWGLQTLSQILAQSEAGVIEGVEIEDAPCFSYRGAHLDCCRHFFTVDEVKKWIDVIALHKLNVFHWHLTEDQGWRIEIKKYPLLTEVGSVRKETKIGNYWSPLGFDGTPYGGFYTQKQCREIVAYAAARQITVIPEIEMPGHAVAALTAYPWLGCRGEGYEVRTNWGISEEVMCAGKETTIPFLKDVLDEVCRIFPSEYIHIGGDEAPRVEWEKCPVCQAKMKEMGYTSEAQLQSMIVNEIEEYLNSKGRRIIGWDEILEGGVTQSATVMSWRGPVGGIAAAKMGNDVIMSPTTNFYFDYYQTSDPVGNGEPEGIGGYLPLRKCYEFDPFDQLSEDEQKHIIGIQANTWTEYIATMDHVYHMDLPRFAALSEVCWSAEKTDYDYFVQRIEAALLPLYEKGGYPYAPYAFEGIE